MSLESYSRNRWIRSHETSSREIADLFAIADRDIEQSQVPGLGPDWRFDIAYNSALQSATAALAVAGFRAERANKHMRVIECLEFTVGLDKGTRAERLQVVVHVDEEVLKNPEALGVSMLEDGTDVSAETSAHDSEGCRVGDRACSTIWSGSRRP